jgi:peptidoglycan/xylan/chitin deacetylase (PgdA/CDA1 family)
MVKDMMREPNVRDDRRITQMLKNRGTRAIPIKLRRVHLSAPIVSFTFDDFAKSAWTEGGRIVEAHGGRATFYVLGDHCGKTIDNMRYYDEEDLIEIERRGHDIGCHTFDHMRLPDNSAAEIESSLQRNAEFLKRTTGRTAFTSFAYPLGLASVRTKRLLANKFVACRGIYPGINRGWTDFSQLSAFCLHRNDLPIAKSVQEGLRRPGWLIFVGHDVSEKPSPFGCTPKALEETLRCVSQAGIEIVTVDAALRRIFGKRAADLNDHGSPAAY